MDVPSRAGKIQNFDLAVPAEERLALILRYLATGIILKFLIIYEQHK